MQSALFPLKVVNLEPSDLNSLDCQYFGKADDGCEYAIKTTEKTVDLPATEWICHWLASGCGIHTPQVNVLLLPDGSKAFGSKWEGGVESITSNALLLTNHIVDDGIDDALSSIFALDYFVWNLDRHLGNYLLQKARRETRIVAIDFSQSLFCTKWPPPYSAMPYNCRTMEGSKALKQFRRFNLAAAGLTLDRLSQITFADLSQAIHNLPSDWLTNSRKDQFCQWWKSDSHRRVSFIRKGLKDGSLF